MNQPNRNDPCPCGSGKKFKKCCIDQPRFRQPAAAPAATGLQALLAQAEQAFVANNYALAERLAEQALAASTPLPQAYYLRGLAQASQGRNDAAQASYEAALQLNKGFLPALGNLALILNQQCKFKEAESWSRQALQLAPNEVFLLNCLGNALQGQERQEEAVACYRRVLELDPALAMAHCDLGSALQALGRFDEAEVCFRRAVSLDPALAIAHNNLGGALLRLARFDEAEACYRRALAFDPTQAMAHNNLGSVLRELGRFDEAEACYRQALALDPDLSMAHTNLGSLLRERGRFDEAEGCYRRALLLNPELATAYSNLGGILNDLGRVDEAIVHCRRAIEIDPDCAEPHNNLGNALVHLGRIDEALVSYRRALEIKPNMLSFNSNYLFRMNFSATNQPQEILAAAGVFEQRFGLPRRAAWPQYGNSRDPQRRLRIGYCSPDFRRHAVASFAEPILANHDPDLFEVFCYAEVTMVDEVTERFKMLADHWYSTVGLSEEAMAALIEEHQIDILVDLTGHTAHNRLLVFARKPAPIQLTYLGYPGTTGLSAMDYRLTDGYTDPVGIADAYYSERLLRLPHSLWCYRPSYDMPALSPLPALQNGYLTFGSFNNFNKIDRATLELWAALLQALPTARLKMMTVPAGEVRQRFIDFFAEHGVTADRLAFHGSLPGHEFVRAFADVDISLDPLTVNGATTTCESLWMGVPVISLTGSRFLTRAGLSILSAAGLPEFAAATPADYLRIAGEMAAKLPQLAELRASLRGRLRTSPLVDEAGFTADLENIYRQIWREWCAAGEAQ
jgi:predicted O-linked N-acetylglucosamine transferase (SPINDLY family)